MDTWLRSIKGNKKKTNTLIIIIIIITRGLFREWKDMKKFKL